MDFRYDVILASGSEVNATPTLFVAKINTKRIDDVVAWHQIEDCIHQDEIEYEPYKIPTSDKSTFVSAFLVKPDVRILRQNLKVESEGLTDLSIPLPTVVRVHGGPHSNVNLSYIPSIVFHAKLGLQTLIINYRGSTGVSEEYSTSLCGKIGELDIGDCMHVIRHFVAEKLIDPANLIISGGSHGGFIAGHLSCQEEFKFTSAIIRNPVMELSSLYLTADIPDWSLTEALGHSDYDFSHILSDEKLVKMYRCSPLSKVDRANVPTFMMLGAKDQRVPMFQGERWDDHLRARGIDTLCKIYQDGHALSKPDVSADHMITEAIWILDHLPKSE